MNPSCGRCNRVVYPTEKLNCLDKYWHKGCFTCEVCNMTLNMKTYKGFNKLPYCTAHYPTTKFTSVADTPENLRLKQQSKNQSQVHYHKDFEKSKGKYTVVSDDPETMRIRNMTENISNVKYHAEHERAGREALQRQLRDPIEAANQPPDRSHNYNYEHTPEPAAASPPSSGKSEHSQNYHYEPAPEPVRPAAAASTSGSGKRFKAMYDYVAADEDEVSFMDGDVIIEMERIDDGWMYGRVERTGQQGMLPANYVEAI